jgi:hypothetical protein
MHEPNVVEVLARLRPHDKVLDIGGWACPFNRAQWVMDAEPYETRGFYRTFGGAPFQAGDIEMFTKDTWIQRDICNKEPYPFSDKYFDFVVCSHTLEDIRDPLWVCSEMIRIGKAGYIEVPSRLVESCRGVESPGMVGYSHHRWLIEIENNRVQFLQKLGLIHSHWRFSLPASFVRSMSKKEAVQWLWWTGGFEHGERILHGSQAQELALSSWIQAVHPYPSWQLTGDALFQRALRFYRRGRNWLERHRSAWSKRKLT